MAQAAEVTRAQVQKRTRKQAGSPKKDYGLKKPGGGPPPPSRTVFNTPATTKTKLQKEVLKDIDKVHVDHHENAIAHVIHAIYGGGHSKSAGSHAAASDVANPMGRSLALSGVGRSAKNMGLATADHPVAVSVNTLKGLRDQLAAAPGGVVSMLTTRPDHTAKSILEDMQSRYGETDAQMRKRFVKEGIAPELVDGLSLTSGVGSVVGKGVTAAVKASGNTGRLAETLTAARPALRTSGGVAKDQKLSDNAFRAVGQRGVDKYRLRKQRKAMAGTEHHVDTARAPGHVVAAERANEAAGKTVEVAPIFGASKAQRVGVARLKSRSVSMLKSEQHRRVTAARKQINGLNAKERKAFAYAATGIVPAGEDAVHFLQKRRDTILAERKATGTPTPRKKVDELRLVQDMLKAPEEHFTPRLARAVKDLRAQDLEVAAHDPALHPDQAALRRVSQQAETLGLRRGEFMQATPNGLQRIHRPETAQDFVARVEKVAARKGLERPLYFPSEPISLEHRPDFSAYAVGGARAVAAPKQYTGKLFREGRQDTHPEVYLTGLARSIKRKHNWNLVADTFDQHAFPGLKNMKMADALMELDRRGVDPNTVSLWNPKRYRDELRTYNEAAAAERHDVTVPDEYGVDHLKTALGDSAVESPTSIPHHLHETDGWSVVPRDAYNEIMASTRPSGKAGRTWDIFRGKQSRFMLSPNPAWNAFQVLSNAGLGAAAVGTKKGLLPVALARQARIYRALSPEGRELVDSFAGEGSAVHGHQVRMGAAMNGKVSKKYRDLKANPLWDKRVAGIGPHVRDLNPLEAGFAVDRWQNAHFRRAVLFQSIKEAEGKLTPQRVEQILRDPAKAEEHAQFMNDWMGDYTTYTHRERTEIARGPMFYGFLRHSLSLVFKTLPRDHPLVLGLTMELGQLQRDELKKLGVDKLPWAKGKYYFTAGGKLREVDLSRANPTLNALTSASGVGQLAGLAGPVAGMAADQAVHASLFKDQQWKVYGHPAPYGAKGSYFNPARPRIAAEDLLGMVPAYRAAEKMTLFGPQGDDSMLFSPRPLRHKNKDLKKADEERAAQDKADADLVRVLMPLIPKVSRDPEIAKTYGIKPKKHKKSKKHNYGFGSGFSGGFSHGFSTDGGF